tara:strand:- start:100 stop:273 length:174 start_codon:yes stop_codon:yes gene_type:complete
MAGTVARTTQIVYDDLRAAPRELQRVLAAQTAASAGDDCYLVLEIDAHGTAPAMSFT